MCVTQWERTNRVALRHWRGIFHWKQYDKSVVAKSTTMGAAGGGCGEGGEERSRKQRASCADAAPPAARPVALACLRQTTRP